MKISILLPYKENFSKNYAGAVSIFVNDILNNSSFKKNINVYGSTNYKNVLNQKYINLDYNKLIFKSNTKSYIKDFLKIEKKNPSQLIEIHNRPTYVKLIKDVSKTKIILFFHNDPLSMSGSKDASDRYYLLNNVDHIIFNSEWSKSRFLNSLSKIDFFKSKISVIYQSVDKKKIDFKSKKKIISFVGKLNKAKGYDVFGAAIIQILNKNKDWSGIVIGDEPREVHNFSHPRLTLFGFKEHKFTLKKLESVSISVICSRWNEPLGRTSLEACSRGCATIITNRGGLPETTPHSIILKNLTIKNLTTKINFLIKNTAIRKKIQKLNYNSFKFTHKYVNKQIDLIRTNLLTFKNVNININKLKFKILHITNFNERYNGRLHYNTGRRLNNGFIRLEHNVLSISDRDIIHRSKTPFDLTGYKKLNSNILKIGHIFKPDLVVLGHADNVSLDTLGELKNINKSIRLAQWFLDPVSPNGPDYKKNRDRILQKSELIDVSFLTTFPESLDFKIKNSHYIPNPCDISFETLDNSKKKGINDLFFGMSHGVHRGNLKKGKYDNREIFLNKLINIADQNINFDFYGLNKRQPIWGDDFLKVISNCDMGLNLSRGKPIKYYSSDRIAQLFGNGLLTFIDRKTMYDDFFDRDEAIFYKDVNDLAEKILKYKRDSKKRKLIAKNGMNKYFKYFNSNLVSQFIINKSFDIKSKDKFLWN